MSESPVLERLHGRAGWTAVGLRCGAPRTGARLACAVTCAIWLAACALPLAAGASGGVIASVELEGSPRGVAVSQFTGDVYIAIQGGQTEGIEVLDSGGALVSNFGSSRGQFAGIAIDQSTGEVYASQPSGAISAFSSIGIFDGEVVDAHGPGAGQLGARIGYLAVNPTNGNVIVADSSNRRLDEFRTSVADGQVSSTEFIRAIGWGVISNSREELQECTTATGCEAGLEGTETGEFGASGPTRVAVDASGAIYAVDPSNDRVERFGPDAGSAAVFAEAALAGTSPSDVAVAGTTSNVYVTDSVQGEQRVLEFAPAGTQTGSQAGRGDGLASDNGLALSSFDGNSYLTSESPASRLVALNTLAPQSVGATEVTADSATLRALVDPGGSRLVYRFEYGEDGAYGSGSVPVAGANAGSGAGATPVSVHLQNLAPSETYHYRVVTVSELAPGRFETFNGRDHLFTTRSMAASPLLPDGRLWEMVSPADKHDAAFEAAPREGGVIQASEDGSAITYVSYASTESEPEGEPSPEWAQIVSRRGSTGWESKDIAPKYGQEWGLRAGYLSAYLAFSADLSSSLVEPPPGANPVPPGAPEQSPYIREEAGCATGAAECPLRLVTEANVPPGTKFGGRPENVTDGASFVGATEDLEHIVLRSEVALTPIGTEQGLYEWNAGQSRSKELELVSLLPESEGDLPAESPALGYRSSDIRNAISSDGTRVIWSTSDFLYMRDVDRGETTLLSGDQGGSGSGEFKPVFQMASADGSKVFFTDEQRLTADSSSEYEQPDLYVYEVTSKPGQRISGHLTDLTPVGRAGEPAAVQGMVLGASEDGTRVYFVTGGVLEGAHNSDGRTAMEGAENLYLEQYTGAGSWEPPKFIATLSRDDGGQGGWKEQLGGELRRLTARVPPNGEWLAFMSDRPLTGYDNLDAASGSPEEEVFLYDAGSGVLVCASCNQTGARPTGVLDPRFSEGASLLVDRPRSWEGHWLAGSLPGWTMHELNGSSVEQPRYLGNSGRLFFDSADALVQGDVNATQDVYEYEPSGVGTCQAQDGCVALVSSGSSSEESAFLDASATSEDVFFLTPGKLLPEFDIDSAYDVYDAHVCNERAPCSLPAAPLPTCKTADSCRAAPSPQPQLLGAPVTATFSGAVNIVKRAVKSKAAPKGKRKLASCRARAKRIKGRRRRAQALRRCARPSRSKHRPTQAKVRGHAVLRRGR
jgi:DNA-binding beta-propeller fold protein YncE